MTSARGSVRSGSRVSSAVYATICHPPKAKSPAAMAAANPRTLTPATADAPA